MSRTLRVLHVTQSDVHSPLDRRETFDSPSSGFDQTPSDSVPSNATSNLTDHTRTLEAWFL